MDERLRHKMIYHGAVVDCLWNTVYQGYSRGRSLSCTANSLDHLRQSCCVSESYWYMVYHRS